MNTPHSATSTTSGIGAHLREWRQRRRLSQLDLASDAEISTRHLSFLETGRAQPSREMVLRLAEHLDVPLRERNALLVAAGFAPMSASRPFTDPSFNAIRGAVDLILKSRRFRRFTLDDVARLTVSVAKVRPFIVTADWRPTLLTDRADLPTLLKPKKQQLELFAA